MPSWDQAQYLRFEAERTRPARELLARVPLATAGLAIDLGCGPGNSTALLRERWPDARVLGVDSSPDMLTRARKDLPELEFVEADVASYRPERADVLFANALFQWVPNHDTLLPGLLQSLKPGGVLAFQVPDNLDQPTHRLMREVEGPWSAATRTLQPRVSRGSPAFYFDLLAPHASEVDIWRTAYEHVMPSPEAIVEWVKGTGLRPYLEVVPDREAYLEAYTAAIDEAYPAHHGGARLLTFPRLFVVASVRS
ncbi:MAG TPA: trans-aconitate 2-methyltransferase [Polyangiales bacterium]|nr:trans-aconitate 2-methyltransferase [Polyangiales bacterium]